MPRAPVEIPTFSLIQRGKTYYVQWWEDGRSRRVSARTTDRSEARRLIATIKAGYQNTRAPDAPTIGQILDGYEKDRAGNITSKATEYACNAIRRHLADLPADALGKAQIRNYLKERRAEGRRGASAQYLKSARKRLSDGTLIRELVTLRAALNWAERERWIEKAPHIEMPSRPAARQRWLTDTEARKLVASCEADHIKLFIVLALHTGARAGAILELTWPQINFRTRRIDFGEGTGRKRRSHVPIDDVLMDALENAHCQRSSDHVIEHKGEPVGSVKTGFRNAVRRASLSDVTPHTLRHTAASWMMQAGLSPTTVAAYLGNSAEVVEKVYGHHHPDYLREASEIVSNRLNSYSGIVLRKGEARE